MSILNARVQGKSKDRKGNIIPTPHGMALQQIGPRVRIALLPIKEHANSFSDKGEPLPNPVSGWALIDTGASMTCVDQEAAQKAKLAVVNSGPMVSATHDNEIVPIYAARLQIEGIPQYVEAKSAYGVRLKSQGLIALLGRDMLARCIFIYNGHDASFSLSL